MATFGDALVALKAWQSVRRTSWPDGQAMSLSRSAEPKLILAMPAEAAADVVTTEDSPRGTTMQLTLATVLAEDWEILPT